MRISNWFIGPSIVVITFFTLAGCKKLVEADAPITSLNAANVYDNDATAISVLTGIYTQMSNSNFSTGGITSLSLTTALSADELTLYSGVTSSLVYYFTNALTNSNTGSYDDWEMLFPYIFYANSAIEGLKNSTSLTPAVKQQLMGEALFFRAFCYFNLVNLYGNVPLVTSTDYSVNSTIAPSPKVKVYEQIVSDLQKSQGLLSSTYLDGTLLKTTTERTRPTKWAATALLARTYLYMENWAGADSAATALINQFTLTALSNTFVKNNSEAIWQLQPVTGITKNTLEAILYTIPITGLSGTANPVYLSSVLINSFEPNDKRRAVWIDSTILNGKTYYYPFKYKINNITTPVNEYIMILRLGEQYLIRSEARTEEGNLSGAISDLDTIRARAGLQATTATTVSSMLAAILHERQVELFTEWGQRWMDLKRSGSVDSIMGSNGVCASKGGIWSSNWAYYPIPLIELQKDPNLVQNAGY